MKRSRKNYKNSLKINYNEENNFLIGTRSGDIYFCEYICKDK